MDRTCIIIITPIGVMMMHFFNNFITNEYIATKFETDYRHIPLHFSHNERTPVQISLQCLHWCYNYWRNAGSGSEWDTLYFPRTCFIPNDKLTFYILSFCWPCISVHLSHYLANLIHNFFFSQSVLFHASTCFEHHLLIIRMSKLHYTASGIITPTGGRLVHLSIFISVTNQLDEQNLFHSKFYFMPLHVSSTICSSSRGQNCYTHPLISHLQLWWYQRMCNAILNSWWWAHVLETCKGMK